MSLAGQKILLGVTAGIAAYKAIELVRRLKERGAAVQVVMTPSAQEFVPALTFQAVSGELVRTALFDEAAEAAMGHIELARWADVVLVAPATADFMARVTAGMANDLLTTLCLATDKPLLFAPAMNRLMWAHPATVDNCRILQSRGVTLLGPGLGDQACGETGPGRMLEPLELVAAVDTALGPKPLAGKRLLITAGPTQEPIDPVRYVSNNSSGKMGYAVAAAAAQLGAHVTLVSGPVALDCPAGVQRVWVKTAANMLDSVRAHAHAADVFIATAAVADYRPALCHGSKVKKHAGSMSLELERTTDVLADLAQQQPHVFTVGFAAETDDLIGYATAKLQNKKLDMVAANWVNKPDRGFDAEQNALTLITADTQLELPIQSKADLAKLLLQHVVEAYQASAKYKKL